MTKPAHRRNYGDGRAYIAFRLCANFWKTYCWEMMLGVVPGPPPKILLLP